MTDVSKIGIVTVVLVTVLLGGCLGPVKPPDPIYFYTVEYAPPKAAVGTVLPVLLRVERFTASPPYDTQRMVYADEGPHRNTYAYHQWISPPGDLLPFLFARDLHHTGGFRAVFTPDSAVRTTHRIHGWIEHFLENDQADGWTASAVVHVTLLSATASDPTKRVILQRRYAADVPATAKTPASLATAMGHAVSKISRAMAEDIYRALSKSK